MYRGRNVHFSAGSGCRLCFQIWHLLKRATKGTPPEWETKTVCLLQHVCIIARDGISFMLVAFLSRLAMLPVLSFQFFFLCANTTNSDDASWPGHENVITSLFCDAFFLSRRNPNVKLSLAFISFMGLSASCVRSQFNTWALSWIPAKRCTRLCCH